MLYSLPLGRHVSALLTAGVIVLAAPAVAAPGLSTFTLPLPSPGNGMYHPDVQSSFPSVDWTTLDRLYLPAGHFKFIRLGNLPMRTAEHPLVITNQGGQVRVGGLGHYYNFVIGGGTHWRLTGRYDADAATGDAGFPGHAGGYANSRDRYGILIDDSRGDEGPSGLAVGGGASDFELDFLEIRHVGFAGMLIKTDDDGDATMANVRIHDNYIHDVGSEGFYIGSTQGEPQHTFTGLRLYNNRVIRTGTEALQLGQLGDDCEIFNNVFLFGAIDWKNPFQNFQDNNTQHGGRFGDISIHHNLFIGGASHFLIFFGQDRTGDTHTPGDTQRIEHNYFSHGRNTGVYVHSAGDGVSTYRFADNAFRELDFQYGELNPSATDHDAIFRIFNTANPIELVDNRWQGGETFAHITGGASVTQSGNVNGPIAPVDFIDSGFPADFDYLRLEIWTDVTSSGDPVEYQTGDYVSHEGALYRALVTHTDQIPPHAATWQALPMPADDVRLTLASPFQHHGLLDNPGSLALFTNGFETGTTDAWSSVAR
ncbi:MAG: hypothetical protein AAGE94_10715 [Acidobacteriota bacterium]